MIRTTRRERSGAAAIELAILLPFLLLMFTAALDFGRIYQATGTLANASGGGAASAAGSTFNPAAAGGNPAAARAAACREGAGLDPPLKPEQVTVAYTATTATVTIDYDFPLLTGVLIPEGTVHLQRTTVTRIAPRPGD